MASKSPAKPAKAEAPKKAAAQPAKAAAPKKAATAKPAKEVAEKPAKAKTAAAPGAKANALQQPLKPSAELAAVVGEGPLPRGEVVSKVWDYIKANNLQNPKDKRVIVADAVLKKVFGKDEVTMFEMNKHLARHLA